MLYSYYVTETIAQGDPNYLWWRYNLAQYLGGYWFSFLSEGKCTATTDQTVLAASNTSSLNEEPCYWRALKVTKRISKNCSDNSIWRAVKQANPACFESCDQPQNISSSCVIDCFFTTLMGPESSSQPYNRAAAIDRGILAQAFLAPFLSSDPAKGGCPTV